jgi:hypothetical protein
MFFSKYTMPLPHTPWEHDQLQMFHCREYVVVSVQDRGSLSSRTFPTAVTKKCVAFSDITPWGSSKKNSCFGGTYRPSFQGNRTQFSQLTRATRRHMPEGNMCTRYTGWKTGESGFDSWQRQISLLQGLKERPDTHYRHVPRVWQMAFPCLYSAQGVEPTT